MMPWSGMQGHPPQAVGSATGELGFTGSRRWVHNVLTARGAASTTTAAVHAARTHAPTRCGIRRSGRPSDQTSPNIDHVRVVANPVSEPARDGGRPTPKPSGSALEKLRAGTEREPVPSLRIIPLCPTMPIEIPSSVG
ncbi:hypothetical protein KVR01_002108 [Diaporthe batatas]|uniref:uncharacterized protein n=1 Tax=Diaporthe batatas TaxID=748121 RepID=UPI001D0531DD|nr:uncharacterized protein KVR01_002108 [Diaporthe batatas]KAG8166419.1 hypothetical protein KVR01_002108 [Diaporthe batatas]